MYVNEQGSQFFFGKTEARPGAVSFELAQFAPTLPKAPPAFGHQGLVKVWGMLGNDQVGDCVIAGGGHEKMVATAEGGHPVTFSEANTLKDYSAVTGYVPGDPSTDNGTDVQVAASYRRKTGLLDAAGKRHKDDAYMALKLGNLSQLASAAYVFGAVGIGIAVTQRTMDQFDRGVYWSCDNNPADGDILGYHYVPVIGAFNANDYYTVSWGRLQVVTGSFIKRFMDEGIVYLSREILANGKTLEGFNLQQLQAALSAL